MSDSEDVPRFGYQAQERQRAEDLRRLWNEFTITRCDLPDEMKEKAIRAAQKALREHTMEKDVATAIKREFEKIKGQEASWHCIVDFFSIRADPEDSDSEGEDTVEKVALVSTTSKSRNTDLLAKEKAALEAIIAKERETIRELLQERDDLNNRVSKSVTDLSAMRRDLDKKDRLVDDLQFELRRVIARQEKSDTDYYRDDAKVRVAERVREFEAHLAAIKVMQDRRVASGMRANKAGGGDVDDELEEMRKQLESTSVLLNEFKLRFDNQGADESHYQRQLSSRDDTIQSLTQELTETQETLRKLKQESARKEQKHLALIHRLYNKLKRQIASVRDIAYLNPKDNLPKFFDEMSNLSALNAIGSDGSQDSMNALNSLKTRLLQKGVMAKLTVTAQGKTLRPRHYFALFVDDTDGVTLRWGSQEAPYEGYSHSIQVASVVSGAAAASQLRSGTIGGEHGQTIASILFEEEESRLIVVSIANSHKKLFLVAGSNSACVTWHSYFNQALSMKVSLPASPSAATATPMARSSCALAQVAEDTEDSEEVKSSVETKNSNSIQTTETATTQAKDASKLKSNETEEEKPKELGEDNFTEHRLSDTSRKSDSLRKISDPKSDGVPAKPNSRRSAFSTNDQALAAAALKAMADKLATQSPDSEDENSIVRSPSSGSENKSQNGLEVVTENDDVDETQVQNPTPYVIPEDEVSNNEKQAIDLEGSDSVDNSPSDEPSVEHTMEETNVPHEENAPEDSTCEDVPPAPDEDSESASETFAPHISTEDVPPEPSEEVAVAPSVKRQAPPPPLPPRKETSPRAADLPSSNALEEEKSNLSMDLLGASEQSYPNSQSEISFPLLASLVKFTHNGKDKHVKFFRLDDDGTVSWGEGPKKLRYAEKIKKGYRGGGEGFSTKMKSEELEFLFTIETSGKDLNILAQSQEIMEIWLNAVEFITKLNPE